MKKIYEEPSVEIIFLSDRDVITDSKTGSGEQEWNSDWWSGGSGTSGGWFDSPFGGGN